MATWYGRMVVRKRRSLAYARVRKTGSATGTRMAGASRSGPTLAASTGRASSTWRRARYAGSARKGLTNTPASSRRAGSGADDPQRGLVAEADPLSRRDGRGARVGLAARPGGRWRLCAERLEA